MRLSAPGGGQEPPALPAQPPEKRAGACQRERSNCARAQKYAGLLSTGLECRWSWTARSRQHRGAISQASSAGGMEGQSQRSDARRSFPSSPTEMKARCAQRDAYPGYSAQGRMWSSWSGHGHPQLCKQARREGDLPWPLVEIADPSPPAGNLFPCPKTGRANLRAISHWEAAVSQTSTLNKLA